MRVKHLLIVVLFLALGLGSGLIVGPWIIKLSQPAPVAQITDGNYSSYLQPSGKYIVMFSLSTCPHCRDARAYLNRNGVAFQEYQIDKSKVAYEIYSKLKENIVPVILTSKHKMLGFSPDGMTKLLQVDGIKGS